VEAYLAAQKQKDRETEAIIRNITRQLTRKDLEPDALPTYTMLEESCLVPVLELHFRNDSLLDMASHSTLYSALHEMCRVLAQDERYLPLFDRLDHQSTSLCDLIRVQNTQAAHFLRATSGGKITPTATAVKDPSTELANNIAETFKAVEAGLEKISAAIKELERSAAPSATPKQAPAAAAAAAGAGAGQDPPHVLYEKNMKPLQFDMVEMDIKRHHYGSQAAGGALVKTAAIRIAQDQAVLIKSLPLTMDSSVFARADGDNISFMRALITGPMASDYGATSTPYAGGCFQFDIHFPPNYPDSPPHVNLETTGHGSIRFNPNLYNCGKVCLSLLGTWSGAEGENWNRNTSTILQVLVSIQSLILVPMPFFNEPGYEQQMGTPYGDQANRNYNDVIRAGTIEHAIIGQLRSPAPDFAEVIRRHFYLQQDRISEQCRRWLEETQAHSSRTVYSHLLKLVTEMQQEFAKLSYPFPKLPK
jgi:baculoviral IAP repeat-containing protein 6